MEGREFGGPSPEEMGVNISSKKEGGENMEGRLSTNWANPEKYDPDVDEVDGHDREIWKKQRELLRESMLTEKKIDQLKVELDKLKEQGDPNSESRIKELETEVGVLDEKADDLQGKIAANEYGNLEGDINSSKKIQSLMLQLEEELDYRP